MVIALFAVWVRSIILFFFDKSMRTLLGNNMSFAQIGNFMTRKELQTEHLMSRDKIPDSKTKFFLQNTKEKRNVRN